MDINNIALVRATNILPKDGIVRPISNSPYLCKVTGGTFSNVMNDLLKEEGIIPAVDPTRAFNEPGYYEKMAEQSSIILKEYLPYLSDYNSCVLFSLNGICPDDNEHGFANNTFANKNISIIAPLKNYIDQVVSLTPTDTAVLGNVVLDQECTIEINKDFFDTLSAEEKNRLHEMPCQVKLFQHDLKNAIKIELENSGKYIPEDLTLTRKYGGFLPSDTSEKQKQNINNIAKQYNKAQVLFYDALTGQNDEKDKLQAISNDLDYAWDIQDYYLGHFLKELLTTMNADTAYIQAIPDILNDSYYMREIANLIKTFGIDNYKAFVDQYNLDLERQRENGTLPTPSEIIQNNFQWQDEGIIIK